MKWVNKTAVGIMAALTGVGMEASAVDELRLNAAPESLHVAPGDTVTVTLDAADISAPINGVQVLMHYDDRVLELRDIVPNMTVNTGWTKAVQLDAGGDLTFVVAQLGGSMLSDHTIATLTFSAISEGTTTVSFRSDDPPKRNKVTLAGEPAVVVPILVNSETMTVTCQDALFCNGVEVFDGFTCQPGEPPCGGEPCDEDAAACLGAVPTVSHWGIVVMTLLLLIAGTIVVRVRLERGAARR